MVKKTGPPHAAELEPNGAKSVGETWGLEAPLPHLGKLRLQVPSKRRFCESFQEQTHKTSGSGNWRGAEAVRPAGKGLELPFGAVSLDSASAKSLRSAGRCPQAYLQPRRTLRQASS